MIIISILLALLIPSSTFAGQGMCPGPGFKTYATSCDTFSGPSSHASTLALGSNSAANYYIGQVVNSGEASKTVCSVQFWFTTKVGDVSSHSVSVKVFSRSGTALDSVIGESQPVSLSGVSNGSIVTFAFSTPVTISAGNAFVLEDPTSDSSNYTSWGYGTSDGDSGWSAFARYNSSKVQTNSTSSYDFQFNFVD